MKFHLAKYVLLAAAFGLVVTTADAQTRKKTTRKGTTAKKATTKKTNTKVSNANLNAVAKDTTPTVVAPPKDPLDGFKTLKSLRNDAAIERNLVKERTPLAYEHIREDDAWYRQRVWREIDIREKMNLPFRYSADEDNGNQRFILILLNAIKSGEVSAFDATVDDRFTTPLEMAKITSAIVGKADSVEVPDLDKDPTGAKGIMTWKVVTNDFNPDKVEKFRIKEEWVFDKESSRMYARIIGIAPLMSIVDKNSMEVLGETPLFWVYYPDLRPILAKYEAYNGKNFGARMSWEELFESRFFSSYITKSTIENPYNMTISGYIKDPILRLLEGDNMKTKIFNFEQDLWSY
jgi:gliding motility associated protien GldN